MRGEWEWERVRVRERMWECFVLLFSWEFVDPNNSVWVKNQVSIWARKTGFLLESRLSVGRSSSTPKKNESRLFQIHILGLFSRLSQISDRYFEFIGGPCYSTIHTHFCAEPNLLFVFQSLPNYSQFCYSHSQLLW